VLESGRTLAAVAQIAYHPAIALPGRAPLADPLFDLAGTDTLRPEGDAPKELWNRFAGLRERVEAAYCRQLLAKLTAILKQCQEWGVRILVLPEYSVPWQILEDLARVGGDLVLVAGTHSVTQASIKSGVYDRLGGARPRIGESVCPVLHRGHLLGLQPKLSPARLEAGWLRPGQTWQPIPLPADLPGPMGVLMGLDCLYVESGPHRDLVLAGLKECRFLAVPSYEPQYTAADSRKAGEFEWRYRGPVLWSDNSAPDRAENPVSRILFDHAPFESGEEGVVIAELSFAHDRRAKSMASTRGPQVVPFAQASLIYRAWPGGEAYAAWLAETEELIAQGDDRALLALSERVKASETTLRDAAPGAKARLRRIDELIQSAPDLTSVDQLKAFLRDVVLPPEVLPLEALRSALAAGASEAVFDWQKEHSRSGLAQLRAKLHQAGALAQAPSPDEWTEPARGALSSLRREVSAIQPRPAPPPAATPAPAPAAAATATATAEVDPALMGELRGGGIVLRFRPHPEDFRAGLEVEPGAAGVVRDLFLLTVAEGRGRTGAVAVGAEGVPAKLVLPVTSVDGRWILRTPEGVTVETRVRVELAAAGIQPLEIETVTSAELRQRTTALLKRFSDGPRRKAKDFQDLWLESVKKKFVEPFVRVGGEDMPALKALDRWLASRDRTALVLGEYGSGKSTTLATWCVRLWERDAHPKPLLCNLAGEASSDPILLLLKAAEVEDTPASRAAMALLVEAGELLPCFDDFAEMEPRSRAEDMADALTSLLAVAGETGRVLISSSDSSLEKVLGEAPGTFRMTLRRFNPDQVKELIGKVLGSEKEVRHALQRISATYDLMDLASRPLLLELILQSLDRIDPSARISPADLYDAYLDRWLTHPPGQDDSLSQHQQRVLGEALAEALWKSGDSSCSWEDLRQTVRERLDPVLPEAPPSDAALREIAGGAFFVREGDRLRFAHRSFLEFFFARSLAATLPKQPRQALDTRPLTPEVAALLGEILRRKGNPRLSEAVRSVQSFLRTGLERHMTPSDVAAAANARQLLRDLAAWAGDGSSWVPGEESGPAQDRSSLALSRVSDLRPPSNPFEPGLPLTTEPLPGREPLVHELISLVEKSYPVALIGPRRVGKTSLLSSVSRRVPGEHPVKRLTLEGKAIRSADDLALLLEPHLGGGGKGGRPAEKLLKDLQREPGRVYLLDEMAWLEEADRTVFPWLRSIGQDRLATIVLAGDRWDWTRVVKRAIQVAPGSSFGNDVTVLDLGPISEEAARRFLVETSRSVIREDTARRVVEICGSWPFYLQVMGHALYVAADARQRDPFTQRDALLDLYHQRLLVDRSAVFQGRFGQLPREVQDLLRSNPFARPEFRSLSQSLRSLLVATGLCTILGEWLSDRPFFDWIRLEANA
jgi:hypothetical protein